MRLHDLLSKAKQVVRGREKQVDRGLDKAEQVISDKTGGKYDDKVQGARGKIDESLGDKSDPNRSTDGQDGDKR